MVTTTTIYPTVYTADIQSKSLYIKFYQTSLSPIFLKDTLEEIFYEKNIQMK